MMRYMGAVTRKELLQTILKRFKKGVGCFEEFSLSVTRQAAWEKMKTASINTEQCLAWGGVNCQFCYLACPLKEKAIQMHDQKPVLIALGCDGCGACKQACETVTDTAAISMTGIRRSQ